MAYELEPLTFTTGQRVDRLPGAQISEPDILQQLHAAQCSLARARLVESAKKLDYFINSGVEQIANTPLPLAANEFHAQDMLAITAAIALGAGDENIAQELHLDFL